MSLDAQQRKVRDRLIECARERRAVTYSEIGKMIAMNARDVGKEVLDPINEVEHDECRPLLSTLVVDARVGFPSRGFFDEASRLRVFKTSEGNEYLDRIAFLHSEVQRVFDAHQ